MPSAAAGTGSANDPAHFFGFSFLILFLPANRSFAEVTRIQILSQGPYAGGKAFGAAGPYVHVRGRFYGEREAAKDPRPSLAERYQDRTGFLSRIRTAAQELQRRGCYLEEDVEKTVNRASRAW